MDRVVTWFREIVYSWDVHARRLGGTSCTCVRGSTVPASSSTVTPGNCMAVCSMTLQELKVESAAHAVLAVRGREGARTGSTFYNASSSRCYKVPFQVTDLQTLLVCTKTGRPDAGAAQVRAAQRVDESSTCTCSCTGGSGWPCSNTNSDPSGTVRRHGHGAPYTSVHACTRENTR